MLDNLKPIHGKKIDKLRLAYLAGDRDDKQEIERAIGALAARDLQLEVGNEPILLPPPEVQEAEGEYELGRVLFNDKEESIFGLHEKDWIQHVGIFGRSGSGKTNVCLKILLELNKKNKPFLIFDWKRNYRDLLKLKEFPEGEVDIYTIGRNVSPFRFNPLVPPKGTDPNTWLKKISEIMAHAFFLGHGVLFLLTKGLDYLYKRNGVYEGSGDYPTFRDLMAWLEKQNLRGRMGLWMDSTLRTIHALTFGHIGDVFNVRENIPIEGILKRNVIFELDALTEAEKIFFIESLLLYIHHHRMSEEGREEFKHAIIIEEAHNVLLRKKQEMDGKEAITDTLMREIREFGESIIIIDQHPSLISIPALGNTCTTIAMNLKHNDDVKALAKGMNLERKQEEYLGMVPIGKGIVKVQGRIHKPFLVEFPLISIPKGSVKDRDIQKVISSDSNDSDKNESSEKDSTADRTIPLSDKRAGVPPDVEMFLNDIVQHPLSTTVQRYTRMKLSGRKGHKIKSWLIGKNYVREKAINANGGQLKILELIEKGLQAVAGKVRSNRFGGPEHEYWCKRLTEHLELLGCRVEREKTIGEGKKVDLEVTTMDGRRIAVEVETGKSDVLGNIKKTINIFDKVVIFLTSPRLEPQVSKMIEKNDLPKIEIMTEKDLTNDNDLKE